MKVIIEEVENSSDEIIVTIRCSKRNEEVGNILSALSAFTENIPARKHGHISYIRVQDVYYFDHVDDKNFLYTESDVYEVSYKLFEVEDINVNFMRISRHMVLNITKIVKFKTAFNGRLDAELSNGEFVTINRNYVNNLKIKLGGLK